MFLRKIASRKLKLLKTKKESNEKKAPERIVEPLYYEEPRSTESSEVEYIEDDDGYIQDDAGCMAGLQGFEAHINTPFTNEKDDILFRSVYIPVKNEQIDDDEQIDDGIVTKLPPHIDEKQHRMSTTGSHSSASQENMTHVTASVTCSESCNTSMASDRYEAKEKRRIEDWRLIMEEKISKLGSNNPQRTLSCLLEVGMMYLQHEEFERAKEYFGKAVAVSEKAFEALDLRTARALELYSMVEVALAELDSTRLRQALVQLDKAFTIRVQLQGPTHIDTIDTLNRIARVHSNLMDFEQARDSFFEVFKIREAIFGASHPSLATSARALALTHKKLYETDTARFYLNYALQVCERSGMEKNSHLFKVLRKDLHDLHQCEKGRIII